MWQTTYSGSLTDDKFTRRSRKKKRPFRWCARRNRKRTYWTQACRCNGWVSQARLFSARASTKLRARINNLTLVQWDRQWFKTPINARLSTRWIRHKRQKVHIIEIDDTPAKSVWWFDIAQGAHEPAQTQCFDIISKAEVESTAVTKQSSQGYGPYIQSNVNLRVMWFQCDAR